MSAVDITNLVGCRKNPLVFSCLCKSDWDLSSFPPAKHPVKWASVNVFILVFVFSFEGPKGPETQACSGLFSEVSACMCRYEIHLHTTIRCFPCKYKISPLFFVNFCICSWNQAYSKLLILYEWTAFWFVQWCSFCWKPLYVYDLKLMHTSHDKPGLNDTSFPP